MKEIRYYVVDADSNLRQISKDDDIVKGYSSSGISLALAYDVEVYQLLKIEILPVDFRVAPIKELPGFYEARRKQRQQDEKQRWTESREHIQRIMDEAKAQKGPNQEVLLRVYETSQSPFKEYDKKNDPRNRVNLSKGIFNRRKKGKRTFTQD